ncbi:MAG: gamma-glutamyl-gamma-aminobutyrate hydrolase family protein, partial [Clostridiales bacterium]|nr:gamma-glutamyl-gamma-aminobutyrate hydrolase family protein [Clostridiales bacterium]
MKPIIGVMPLWDEKKDSIWMLPGYMDGVSQAGGIPIILPLSDDKNEISQLVDICDGLLFTGGQDVSPYIYNEEPLNETTSCCEKRDSMELLVLNLAISSDIPVLGICRGIQFINAALGEILYQDIPLQLYFYFILYIFILPFSSVFDCPIVYRENLFREIKRRKLISFFNRSLFHFFFFLLCHIMKLNDGINQLLFRIKSKSVYPINQNVIKTLV